MACMDSHTCTALTLNTDALYHAAELLLQADALIVAAGAGMGVDSGLPDFRGTAGFWNAYPALARDRIDFASISCPDTFHDYPARAWGFYGHRLQLYRKTQPHAGFQILRRWGAGMHNGCSVFTSNVDGQFQKAGFDPSAVNECHGSIHHLQCLKRCTPAIWPADDFEPDVDEEQCLLRNAPPRCPHCGGMARPNIMMFSDWDWLHERQAAQSRQQDHWLLGVKRPVVVEMGAGTAIPSVRHFSQHVLHRYGGRLVRLNPRDFTVPTSRDVGFAGGALAALQAIDAVMAAMQG